MSRGWDTALGAAAVVACVTLAALRMTGSRGEFFQGVAHVWVGGLFGYALGGRGRFALALALALTAVEILAFLTLRGHE